jgi:MFS transporter, PPP family, 3-phenylpropionic acid transporter
MTVKRGGLIRFMTLYAALFSGFGFASPFLPAFLAERGLGPEEVGLVLGAATAMRLICGPVAGRLADRFQVYRAEFAVCAILAASAALLYLAAHGFWTAMAVSLLQAPALAPLVPLADASAAFVAGTLLAGQAAGGYGLSAIIWLSATALLTTPIAASFVPAFPAKAARDKSNGEIPHRPWLTLLRQRAFVRVTLVAALVLGSHAMYDSFAVIRWTQAGISPATVGVLWSESVAAEVVVFLFLGPRLLRAVTPTVALAVAASCGLVRWAVMAQTVDAAALALVQPLHGFTFAILHLASMRIMLTRCQELWLQPRRRSMVSSGSAVRPPF